MKSLLLEAYVKGQQELLYVVPFVAKVLESSVRSVVCVQSIRRYLDNTGLLLDTDGLSSVQVFRPPNPWTMAIMNVLSELHQEHDLKVSSAFSIIFGLSCPSELH